MKLPRLVSFHLSLLGVLVLSTGCESGPSQVETLEAPSPVGSRSGVERWTRAGLEPALGGAVHDALARARSSLRSASSPEASPVRGGLDVHWEMTSVVSLEERPGVTRLYIVDRIDMDEIVATLETVTPKPTLELVLCGNVVQSEPFLYTRLPADYVVIRFLTEPNGCPPPISRRDFPTVHIDPFPGPAFVFEDVVVRIEDLRLDRGESPEDILFARDATIEANDVQMATGGGTGLVCVESSCSVHRSWFVGAGGEGIGWLCFNASCFGSADRFSGLEFGSASVFSRSTVLIADYFDPDVDVGAVVLDPHGWFVAVGNEFRSHRDGLVLLSDNETEAAIALNSFEGASNSALQIDAPGLRSLVNGNVVTGNGAGLALYGLDTSTLLWNRIVASPGVFLGDGTRDVLIGPNAIDGEESVVDRSPETAGPFSPTSNTVCTIDIDQDGRPEARGDFLAPNHLRSVDLRRFAHLTFEHEQLLEENVLQEPFLVFRPTDERYMGADQPVGFVTPSPWEVGDEVVIEPSGSTTIFAVDGPGGTLSTNPPTGNPRGPYEPQRDEVGVTGDARARVLGHAVLAGVRMAGAPTLESDEVIECTVPVVVVEILDGPFRDRIVAVHRATRMSLVE